VAPGGYAWWYVDGVSDDGEFALTVIAFQGSVFSPYYFWSDHAEPLDHCAINVALYGRFLHKWTMTERGAGDVHRAQDRFEVGPSRMHWDGTCLTLLIDERTPPFPTPMTSRVRGRIRVYPQVFTRRAFDLDAQARHVWWPIAPMARIEVEFLEPSLRWHGHGYVDSNRGAEPLEVGFRQWHWSRAPLGQDAAVIYDVESRRAPVEPLAIRFDKFGEIEPLDLPHLRRLMPTRWLVPRRTRTDAGGSARVVKTLEDSPFYARTLMEADVGGTRVPTVHESLSLDRFASPIVKWMLPYKMPRVARKRSG
jgi:carotenoid 1,2-hydratase